MTGQPGCETREKELKMIKTRIASAAAAFMCGLAAIGGTVLTVAAPANAAPST